MHFGASTSSSKTELTCVEKYSASSSSLSNEVSSSFKILSNVGVSSRAGMLNSSSLS